MKVLRRDLPASGSFLLPREPPRNVELHAGGVHMYVRGSRVARRGMLKFMHAPAATDVLRSTWISSYTASTRRLAESGWILKARESAVKRDPRRRGDCDPIRAGERRARLIRITIRRSTATMTTITVVLLLLTVAMASSLPLANVHVKFVSPPDVYEHSITTDGDRTLAQKSFISIGRRSAAKRSKDHDYNYRTNLRQNHVRQVIPITNQGNAESLWPVGVFLPPIDVNDLGYSWQEVHRDLPDFYKSQRRDPYLLTNREAMMAVKYLYGLGELFFDNYPHTRALLRNQEERRQNGLHGHVLGSLNPRSPFHRKDGKGLS